MTVNEQIQYDKIVGYNNYLLQELSKYRTTLHKVCEEKKKLEKTLGYFPIYRIIRFIKNKKEKK